MLPKKKVQVMATNGLTFAVVTLPRIATIP